MIVIDDGSTDATAAIAEAAAQERPFFLYFAHYAPHWPLHAKPEDIAKYRELYRKLGWDEARSQRYRRLAEEGLIPAATLLSFRDPRALAWAGARNHAWEAERMATFAAQVDSLDQSVGRVLEALRRTGAHVFLALPAPSTEGTFVGHTLRSDRALDVAMLRLGDFLDRYARSHAGEVSTIDLAAHVCPGGPPCRPVVGGEQLRPIDGTHFSPEGSVRVASWLWSQIRASAPRSGERAGR